MGENKTAACSGYQTICTGGPAFSHEHSACQHPLSASRSRFFSLALFPMRRIDGDRSNEKKRGDRWGPAHSSGLLLRLYSFFFCFRCGARSGKYFLVLSPSFLEAQKLVPLYSLAEARVFGGGGPPSPARRVNPRSTSRRRRSASKAPKRVERVLPLAGPASLAAGCAGRVDGSCALGVAVCAAVIMVTQRLAIFSIGFWRSRGLVLDPFPPRACTPIRVTLPSGSRGKKQQQKYNKIKQNLLDPATVRRRPLALVPYLLGVRPAAPVLHILEAAHFWLSLDVYFLCVACPLGVGMCNSGIMASDERVGNTDKQTGCAIGSSKELWLSEQGRKMSVCMAPRETSRVRVSLLVSGGVKVRDVSNRQLRVCVLLTGRP